MQCKYMSTVTKQHPTLHNTAQARTNDELARGYWVRLNNNAPFEFALYYSIHTHIHTHTIISRQPNGLSTLIK